MNFHVTFRADDLLGMEYTGDTSVMLGHQLAHKDFMKRECPSLFVKPGELRAISEHFAALAEQLGE